MRRKRRPRAPGHAHPRLDAQPRSRRLLLRARRGSLRQGRARRLDPRPVRSVRAAQARGGRAKRSGVSYEQEVFFAGARKLPVFAVASVIGEPLNSFMSIDPSIRSLADLKGHSVGVTGVPADYAALESAGLTDDV